VASGCSAPFAGDPTGSKLPQNHGPWTVTGVVGPDKAPPHNFSRDAIEEAIDVEGFQLWRLGKKMEASKPFLKWTDYNIVDEGRNKRNDLAHGSKLLSRKDCLRYIEAIGVELKVWGCV
jgi:hypothetical protein